MSINMLMQLLRRFCSVFNVDSLIMFWVQLPDLDKQRNFVKQKSFSFIIFFSFKNWTRKYTSSIYENLQEVERVVVAVTLRP